MSKQRLQGKVAIVTGAASGIGAEAVRIFVENGASVVIADVDDELGHQVATSIGSDKVSYRHCDVRDEKQVEETVAFALEKYGSLDIMFSNAGIAGPMSSILEFDLNEFDNTMAVNVRGVAATIKHAARVMVAKKTCGSIICTASVAASVAGMSGHDYTTSKHGLIGLVRSTCSELGAYGIRVNSVSPYIVATPLACKTVNMEHGEIEAAGLAFANLHGITLKATHIAEAALFLASDESAYISGQNLVVDGGFSVVNAKGASSPAALGGIFRDHSAATLGCFVVSLGINNALYAKLMGVINATEIANRRWHNLWDECDSQLVILACRSDSIVSWKLRNQ